MPSGIDFYPGIIRNQQLCIEREASLMKQSCSTPFIWSRNIDCKLEGRIFPHMPIHLKRKKQIYPDPIWLRARFLIFVVTSFNGGNKPIQQSN